MKKKDVVILAIAMIIIVVGIILTFTIGFNKQLRFSESQKIDVYVETEVDLSKIKNITNEVLGKNMVQIVEIYEDMVTIRAKSITEEQRDNIISKIKENYEFEQKAEDTEIVTIPGTRVIDMFKKYIKPFAIAGAIILVYMLIRYFKKGIMNVLLNTIAIPVLSELVLISIFAIARIPVGIFTPTFVLVVYLASIVYVVGKVEKQPNATKTR